MNLVTEAFALGLSAIGAAFTNLQLRNRYRQGLVGMKGVEGVSRQPEAKANPDHAGRQAVTDIWLVSSLSSSASFSCKSLYRHALIGSLRSYARDSRIVII